MIPATISVRTLCCVGSNPKSLFNITLRLYDFLEYPLDSQAGGYSETFVLVEIGASTPAAGKIVG